MRRSISPAQASSTPGGVGPESRLSINRPANAARSSSDRTAALAKRSSTISLMAECSHAALRKFTTVDAKYAPQVRTSKTSDDDMKQECVQWHSFALIDARCASAAGENQSL